jgi:rhodanese-related sulfurtransferase
MTARLEPQAIERVRMDHHQPELPSLGPDELAARLWVERAPLVIDVRREPALPSLPRFIAGAALRRPEAVEAWAGELPRDRAIVVYCVLGNVVSQGVGRELRSRGLDAAYLLGGLEGWRERRLPTARWRPPLGDRASQWVTHNRPTVDRIACTWLIHRFLDPLAAIRFVPSGVVEATAAARGATRFDVPEAEFGDRGGRTSFDALLDRFEIKAPGLPELATIVRGAETGRLELAPESAGLRAALLGLARLHRDDAEELTKGMMLCDALYAWASQGRELRDEAAPLRLLTATAA